MGRRRALEDTADQRPQVPKPRDEHQAQRGSPGLVTSLCVPISDCQADGTPVNGRQVCVLLCVPLSIKLQRQLACQGAGIFHIKCPAQAELANCSLKIASETPVLYARSGDGSVLRGGVPGSHRLSHLSSWGCQGLRGGRRPGRSMFLSIYRCFVFSSLISVPSAQA